MDDLAVIIVSYGSARWLPACLESVQAHAGDISLDVVVADTHPDHGTAAALGDRFPEVRVIDCESRGFAHGNNCGYRATDARYALFINPDTEILNGTLAELVSWMDRHPGVGALGCTQRRPGGELIPTIRRFPSVLRATVEALGSERWARRWSPGHRDLRPGRYSREGRCDWVSGSFVLARREALGAAGPFDERFFLYCEEIDLCRRIRAAGFQIAYTPAMEILHHDHSGAREPDSRLDAQHALAQRQYAFKHFSPSRARAYLAALGCGEAIRGAVTRANGGGHGR